MAHTIIHQGRRYRLAIAEFTADRSKVRIIPYTEEVHSTAFVDGTIEITLTDGRYGYRRAEVSGN